MSGTQSSQEPPSLDDILLKLNFFGRYYSGFISLMVLVFINDIISCTLYIFTAEQVNYWCVDERFGNDSCAGSGNSSEVCPEWIYEDPHSFVAEFQLACQEWKRTLVGTVQGFGYGVGLLIIGPLSDRLGRKPLIVLTATMCGVIGVARSFCSNYWLFVILEFLGAGVGNCYSPAYILIVEMVAHKKRVLTQTLASVASAVIGFAVVPLAAWIIPYWRHLMMALYGPSIMFILLIFLLDESPRWLFSKGQKDKATDILEKTAKMNKAILNRNDLDKLSNCKREDVSLVKSIKDTCSSKTLMKRFLLCFIWWTASIFVNYGLRINSVMLPGNKYVNFSLIGIAGIPGKFITYWVLKFYTRKSSLISSFFLCALVCTVQPFIPEYSKWLPIMLFLVGKMLALVVISVTYIFTSELFPTYTRNSTHALCSSLGRVGSMLAAQTPLLIVYWHGAPALTFGAASLVAGLLTILAPDSTDDALPDTVQQAEVIGTKPTEQPNVELAVDLVEATAIPRDFRGVLTIEMTKRKKSLKRTSSTEQALPFPPSEPVQC